MNFSGMVDRGVQACIAGAIPSAGGGLVWYDLGNVGIGPEVDYGPLKKQ